MDHTGTRVGGGGDSDGEDAAMTYFLPNGITDDSPPKRSTIQHSSFGPIGGRFGNSNSISINSSPTTSRINQDTGMFRQRAVSASPSLSYSDTNQPSIFSRLNLSSGRSSDPSLMSSITSSTSSSRSPFLLSELGGEIVHTSSTTRTAFSPFSGAFSALGGSSDTTTSPFGSTSTGFRQDDDALFTSSSVSPRGFLGRRPPLSGTTVDSSYLSSNRSASNITTSTSHWPTPTPTKQPLSAPPGLCKPNTEEPSKGQHSLLLPTPSTELSAYSPPFEYLRTPDSEYSSQNHLPELRMSSDAFLMTPTTEYTRPMRTQEWISNSEIDKNFDTSPSLSIRTKVGGSNATPRRTGRSPRTEKRQAPSPEDKRESETKERGCYARTPTRRGEVSKMAMPSPATTGRGNERRAASRVQRESKEVTVSLDAPVNEPSARSNRKQRNENKTLYRPVATCAESSTTQHNEPIQDLITISTETTTTSRTSKGREGRTSSSKRGQSSRNVERAATITVTRRQVYREKVQQHTTISSTSEEIKDVSVDKLSGSEGDGDDTTEVEESVKIGDVPRVEENLDKDDDFQVTPPHTSGSTAPKEWVEKDTKEMTDNSAVSTSPVSTSPKKVDNTKLDVPVDETTMDQVVTAGADQSNQPTHDVSVQLSLPLSQNLLHIEQLSPHLSQKPTEDDFPPLLVDSYPTEDVNEVSLSLEDEKYNLDLNQCLSTTSSINTPPHSASSTSSEKKSKKERNKKDKGSEKKGKNQAQGKGKKDKRDSNSKVKGELSLDDVLTMKDIFKSPTHKTPLLPCITSAILSFVRKMWSFICRFMTLIISSIWQSCVKVVELTNLHSVLGAGFAYIESGMAVVFSVILLLSLHGASWFIRIHRSAFRAVLMHRHIGFCFVFLYAFPFLVQYVFPWAPPWAPVCLWYAFLVQLFCTSGPTAMVTTFRILLPLVFLVEGISHHSFLLDLTGAELLLASFILSAMKTRNLCSPIFLLSLSAQCLSTVFLGSELITQWFQMALALYSLHSMAGSDEERCGFGDEDDDISCHSMPLHHSIADYNSHPAPSAPSIQKTKRLDRRALAFVRGRKLR